MLHFYFFSYMSLLRIYNSKLAFIKVYLPFFLLLITLFSCDGRDYPAERATTGSVVKIVKTDNGYQLMRNGEPYFIKGAGGYTSYESLAKHGGNSIRVWDTNDATRILDKAHELGLTVCLGIWIIREKEGFNYDDKKAVQKQYEQIKREVLKYKDHPALLMWNIGNEVNAGASNVRVWDAVNDIAKMIHQLDPNHPTTTTLMDVQFRAIRHIVNRSPEIDILSINSYGGIASLPDDIRTSDWDGPYIISEFGAKGYWETEETKWKEPIEQTSTEKTYFIREKYQLFIKEETSSCLGAYVFYWGHKQEKTHTWFSLFSEKGEKTEMVDMMQNIWTGSWPENRAPLIVRGIHLNGKQANHHSILKPESSGVAEVIALDPEQDSLSYHWEVLPEIEVNDGAVDRLKKPKQVEGVLPQFSNSPSITLRAPDKEGAYRLFVTISDGNNNIATANIPFYVEGYPEIQKMSENQSSKKSGKFWSF